MNFDIVKYKNKTPEISKSVFIADGVKIIGDVTIDDNSSIWFNSVIRADVNFIKIGKKTNIQDGSIIHVSSNGFSANGKKGFPTIIGDFVTIGHNATIHACRINNYALIGMGAVILDNSFIDEYSFVAAGAVVTPGTKINKHELWAGNPAKFVRKVTDIEIDLIKNTPVVYEKLSKEFLKK